MSLPPVTTPPADPPHQIIETPDGSRTAHNLRFGEAYGSRHGAHTQARHVFVEGTRTDVHPAPRVLEIGFGLGVNFRATLADAVARGVRLDYVAYEFDPAPAELLRAVSEDGAGAEHPAWQEVLDRWPHAPFEIQTENVRLTVHFVDVLSADLLQDWATALYLDGFSPTRNPEVWTPDFISRLAGTLALGGILATYSAAGHVRRALAAAGLSVERRPGAPGKRECLRAVR
ncbi:tRNA (5-methylaminomethyl-2-thiouridine)(34)-methyltransferase MnmD [Deinococcus sp. AJ005]|uniref:tRNA (5-methylaminomethyl-2-thiouridine)(34)-methyltransferase MnmD n=1 Tax=Deinococcus sp. AJ005 TaxID=2652443 RepID=UPI00125CAA7A|nr:tRNA (5-methylaminomethyl-2-thiouridine)(34)-methyltransferase MnmD [Deinococcus sp. AJ005]QFP77050.1 tRNA (5-methylaminomethyl-2-thiouridine)(34)-methyltransferase MnmD [Deinococcus sp. AJ005]